MQRVNTRTAPNASEFVKLWFHRIDKGIARRDEEQKIWDANEKFEDMQVRATIGVEGYDDVCINKCGAWVETRVASVVYHSPYFKMKPINTEGYDPVPIVGVDGQPRQVYRYKVAEGLLNDIARRIGVKRQLRRGVHAAQFGYGAWMIGYTADFEGEDIGLPKEVDGMPNPEVYMYDPVTALPMVDENEEPILRPEYQRPLREQWFWDWVYFRRLIVDPDGENEFRQHRWIVYEELVPLKEIKANPLYRNTSNLKATHTGYTSEQEDDHKWKTAHVEDDFIQQHEDMCRVFHCWDLEEQEYAVVVDGHHRHLRRVNVKDAFPGVEHSPYIFYRPKERNGHFYPRPPLTDLAPVNEIYDLMRQLEITAGRRVARKLMVEADVWGEDQRAQLRSNVDVEVIPIESTRPLSETIMEVPLSPLSSDVWNNTALTAQDFNEVGGQPGESRARPDAKTATQAKAMVGYDSLRVDYQRNLLKEAIIEGGEKLWNSIKHNMTLRQAVMLEGKEGEGAFLAFVDPEEIGGDYMIEVDVEEMAPQDKNLVAANTLNAIGVFSQGMQTGLWRSEALLRSTLDNIGMSDPRIVEELVKIANEQFQLQQQQMQMAAQRAQQDQQMKQQEQQRRDMETVANLAGSMPAAEDEAHAARQHRDDPGMLGGRY